MCACILAARAEGEVAFAALHGIDWKEKEPENNNNMREEIQLNFQLRNLLNDCVDFKSHNGKLIENTVFTHCP